MSTASDLAVVTVTTVNYLHRTRALMHAVARDLPDARRLVCFVDPPDLVDPAAENFEILDACSLGLPRFRQLSFALNATGLCCALKPHAALHAFATGTRRVIYLDNDIQLFRRPDEMLAALDRHQFVLTAHLLRPVPPGAQPDEATVLAYGPFNAGMFAVRRETESVEFLRWWGTRTFEPASMQPQSGYDQIWLSFAPTFLADFTVMRDEGYNVASWNLASRRLTIAADGFRAGDAPLTTFHFSWFDEADPTRLVSPKAQCNYRSGTAEAALLEGYAKLLTTCGSSEWSKRPYRWSRLIDGRAISPEQRRIFSSQCWGKISVDADPFNPEFSTSAYEGSTCLHQHDGLPARSLRALRRLWRAAARIIN